MTIILRALGAAVATAVAVPLVLALAYGFIDPPSLPILRRQTDGQRVTQVWRPLSEMSPELVQAVVMAEDARFCMHWGVDLAQFYEVAQDAVQGEPIRGASTVTMQVVRNLFLWPQRSYLRKAVEIPLAVWLDLVLSKDRILEIYLNVAQWGPDIYGAEAGANRWFSVPASSLTEPQALALATMLPAPGVRDPLRPTARQRASMARVAHELKRAPWVFTCLPERVHR